MASSDEAMGTPATLAPKAFHRIGDAAAMHPKHGLALAELETETARRRQVEHAPARTGIEQKIERGALTEATDTFQPDHAIAVSEGYFRGRMDRPNGRKQQGEEDGEKKRGAHARAVSKRRALAAE